MEPLKSLLGRFVLYYLQYLNNYLGQLINLKHTQLILNLYISLGIPIKTGNYQGKFPITNS